MVAYRLFGNPNYGPEGENFLGQDENQGDPIGFQERRQRIEKTDDPSY